MTELRDVVVVDAIRTPMGRSGWKAEKKKGLFYYSTAHELTGQVIKALTERAKLLSNSFDASEIEDVAWGCSAQFGEQGGNLGRIAVLVADLPDEIAGWTVDRYCNAGLQAVNSQMMAIATGAGDIMVAGGTEFLSRYPLGSSIQAIHVRDKKKRPYKHKFHKKFLKKSNIMGQSAELVAAKWNLRREDLDDFSAWSHRKATESMRDTEWYKRRICPIRVDKYEKLPDGKEKKVKGESVWRDVDETVRTIYLDEPDKAMEKIRSLKPRFKADGVVTAGNSSAIVDGSAACLLMSREKADELGIKPLATYVSSAVSGSDPILMLEGPIPAQHKALKRAGKSMEDMEVIEPNEAFASPCLAFAKEFEYDYLDPRVNPTGGGVSIGHPIGCSGVLYFSEMCWAMNKMNVEWGIQTLCGGGGVGIATVMKRDKKEKSSAESIDLNWKEKCDLGI